MTRTKLFLFVFLTITTAFIAQTELPVYKNANKKTQDRVDDLLKRMTVEEKVELLGGNGMKTMVNNRLDIPEIIMTDGPLGSNIKKHSTNYSAMINLAAQKRI